MLIPLPPCANISGAGVDFTGWSFDDDSRIAGVFDLFGFGVVAHNESVIITEDTADDFREDWALTSLNLANYQVTATYALPRLTARQASAITYNWDTNTLFVLGDEGEALVECDESIRI